MQENFTIQNLKIWVLHSYVVWFHKSLILPKFPNPAALSLVLERNLENDKGKRFARTKPIEQHTDPIA